MLDPAAHPCVCLPPHSTVSALDLKGETQTECSPQARECSVEVAFSHEEGGKHPCKRNHVMTIY